MRKKYCEFELKNGDLQSLFILGLRSKVGKRYT